MLPWAIIKYFISKRYPVVVSITIWNSDGWEPQRKEDSENDIHPGDIRMPVINNSGKPVSEGNGNHAVLLVGYENKNVNNERKY